MENLNIQNGSDEIASNNQILSSHKSFRRSSMVVIDFDFRAGGQGSIPPDAAIHLASECNFARANPCHVRGIGYHHSDTRVWGSAPDIVSGVIVVQ